MQEIWFAVLGILSLVLVSPGSPEAAAPHPMLADAQTVLEITKDDRILGKPEAPITIVEYASLTCPHCAHFANDVLPEIKKAWIDTFFAAQEKWVRTPDYREALARLAKLGGMGKEEFDACLKNTELENKIVEGRLKATQELEVNSTPTFFVNGSKLAGAPTVEEFEKLLSSLAAKS